MIATLSAESDTFCSTQRRCIAGMKMAWGHKPGFRDNVEFARKHDAKLQERVRISKLGVCEKSHDGNICPQ